MPKVMTEFGDLLSTTIDWYDKQYTQTQLLTEYVLLELFFGGFGSRAPNVKPKRMPGGLEYTRQIRARTGGTFKFVDFYEVNPPRRADVNVTVRTPIRHWEEKAVWDEKEVDHNSGPSKIIDAVEEQMDGKYEAIANAIELALALAPVSDGHTKSLHGLPLWFRTLNLNEEDPIGGFNGRTIYFQDGTSTNILPGGADLTRPENNRLQNWAATHNGELNRATIKTIRRGLTRTGFMALPQLGGDKGTMSGRVVLLADHDMVDQAEEQVQQGPDDIGEDLARSKGPRIRSAPLLRVPVFDFIPYRPIYGLRLGPTHGMILKDRWLKRGKPKNHPDAEDTWSVTIKGSVNLTTKDARAGGFVIHQKRTAA